MTRLLLRQAVAAKHELEAIAHAGEIEQPLRERMFLVRDTAQTDAAGAHPVERGQRVRVEPATDEQVVAIAREKGGERGCLQLLAVLRPGAGARGLGLYGMAERARNQGLEAVADPNARPGLPGWPEAHRMKRTAETMRDVGGGVDQRAVEVYGE